MSGFVLRVVLLMMFVMLMGVNVFILVIGMLMEVRLLFWELVVMGVFFYMKKVLCMWSWWVGMVMLIVDVFVYWVSGLLGVFDDVLCCYVLVCDVEFIGDCIWFVVVIEIDLCNGVFGGEWEFVVE